MRVDPNSTIAGMPAKAIRASIRRARGNSWTVEFAEYWPHVPTAQTDRIVKELMKFGYVEVATHQHAKKRCIQ